MILSNMQKERKGGGVQRPPSPWIKGLILRTTVRLYINYLCLCSSISLFLYARKYTDVLVYGSKMYGPGGDPTKLELYWDSWDMTQSKRNISLVPYTSLQGYYVCKILILLWLLRENEMMKLGKGQRLKNCITNGVKCPKTTSFFPTVILSEKSW